MRDIVLVFMKYFCEDKLKQDEMGRDLYPTEYRKNVVL